LKNKIHFQLIQQRKYWDYYSHIPMHPKYFGINNLSEKLMRILKDRMDHNLPKIKERVQLEIEQLERTLIGLGEAPPDDNKELRKFISNIIGEFVKLFKDTLNGMPPKSLLKEEEEEEEDNLGEQFIRRKFEQFSDEIENGFRLTSIKDSVIEKSLGLSAPIQGFIPYDPFPTFIKEETMKLTKPSMRLHQDIKDHVTSLVKLSGDNVPSLSLLPKLKLKLESETKKLIEEYAELSANQIKGFIQSLANYIYTSSAEYEDLVDSSKTTSSTNSQVNAKGSRDSSRNSNIYYSASLFESNANDDKYRNKLASSGSSISVEPFKMCLKGYFKETKREIEASVPKFIGAHVVFELKENIHITLFDSILCGENFTQYAEEDFDISQRRRTLESKLEVYENARDILSNFSLL